MLFASPSLFLALAFGIMREPMNAAGIQAQFGDWATDNTHVLAVNVHRRGSAVNSELHEILGNKFWSMGLASGPYAKTPAVPKLVDWVCISRQRD